MTFDSWDLWFMTAFIYNTPFLSAQLKNILMRMNEIEDKTG
jgi:hypothetical protein